MSISFFRRYVSIAIGFLLCVLWSARMQAAEFEVPKPFNLGGLKQIVESHSTEPLIINFWSIDCTYCQQELVLLRKLISKNPTWRLALVSADAPENAQSAAAVLRQQGFNPAKTWIFADSYLERLRFDVDRNWYGELPRTYFYISGKQVAAISGKLDEATVTRWLSPQTVTK